MLAPEVTLGRASGESGCRGMRQGRSEGLSPGDPGGGGRVDGLCLASGSFTWSDRRGFASRLWDSALGINPFISLSHSLLISEIRLITVSVLEFFGDLMSKRM